MCQYSSDDMHVYNYVDGEILKIEHQNKVKQAHCAGSSHGDSEGVEGEGVEGVEGEGVQDGDKDSLMAQHDLRHAKYYVSDFV